MIEKEAVTGSWSFYTLGFYMVFRWKKLLGIWQRGEMDVGFKIEFSVADNS